MKWKDEQNFWLHKYRIITTKVDSGIIGLGWIIKTRVGTRVGYCYQYSNYRIRIVRIIVIWEDTKLIPITMIHVYISTQIRSKRK